MKDHRGSSGAVFPLMSQSSVAVADPSTKKTQSDPSSSATTTTTAQGLEETVGAEATKEKAAATPASPGIVTAGVQRLMKGIKSLSQMFAVYKEDNEEEEQEMVIGYPTDVQHVGHIGWDGHGGLNKVGAMGMVNALSLPSSLLQAARGGHGSGRACLRALSSCSTWNQASCLSLLVLLVVVKHID